MPTGVAWLRPVLERVLIALCALAGAMVLGGDLTPHLTAFLGLIAGGLTGLALLIAVERAIRGRGERSS